MVRRTEIHPTQNFWYLISRRLASGSAHKAERHRKMNLRGCKRCRDLRGHGRSFPRGKNVILEFARKRNAILGGGTGEREMRCQLFEEDTVARWKRERSSRSSAVENSSYFQNDDISKSNGKVPKPVKLFFDVINTVNYRHEMSYELDKELEKEKRRKRDVTICCY
ncbi:unnamed protein product [Thlaspi arvense]|uniref:Uncharacterized protein n=1 Tax=Thlaspi arvense TaxID=13288 RepID=A0AAU9SRE1_THLAR|nr:unnamed protein product [Thlaspi arvense]